MRNFRLGPLVALLLLSFACLSSVHGEPDPALVNERRRQVGEIGRRVAQQRIPLSKLVIEESGNVVVEFRPEATPGQRAETSRICDEVMASTGSEPVEVDNLVDALVVLRFEPKNASALEIVRARYDELRNQAQER